MLPNGWKLACSRGRSRKQPPTAAARDRGDGIAAGLPHPPRYRAAAFREEKGSRGSFAGLPLPSPSFPHLQAFPTPCGISSSRLPRAACTGGGSVNTNTTLDLIVNKDPAGTVLHTGVPGPGTRPSAPRTAADPGRRLLPQVGGSAAGLRAREGRSRSGAAQGNARACMGGDSSSGPMPNRGTWPLQGCKGGGETARAREKACERGRAGLKSMGTEPGENRPGRKEPHRGRGGRECRPAGSSARSAHWVATSRADEPFSTARTVSSRLRYEPERVPSPSPRDETTTRLTSLNRSLSPSGSEYPRMSWIA
jgi:hypothetical protein